MTVNLLQMDKHGQESITSMFTDPEERATMEWLYSLEVAAAGVTIFVHRLSEPGHERLCQDPSNPPRYCGCYDCIDQRNYLRDYTARAIIFNMRELIPPELAAQFLHGSSDVLDR